MTKVSGFFVLHGFSIFAALFRAMASYSRTILILTLIVLSGCAHSTYKVVNHYNGISSPENRLRKLVLISDHDIPNSNHFTDLINKKRWASLHEEFRLIEDQKTKCFLQSVSQMVEGKYLIAYNTLKKLNETDFDCEVMVLKADCLFELKVDSVDFLKKYQAALDCTSDEKIKEIAIRRYRFIKYGI